MKNKRTFLIICLAMILPLTVGLVSGCKKRGSSPNVSKTVVQRDDKIINLLKDLRNSPDNSDIMISISERYSELNKSDDAKVWLEKALKNDPYSGKARTGLIELLEKEILASPKKDITKTDAFKKLQVLGVKKARMDILQSKCLVLKGREILNKGNREEAKKLFKQASLNKNPEAYIAMINMAIEDESLLDAARASRDALIKFPENRDILKLAAQVDMKAGNFESARNILQKVQPEELEGSKELFDILLEQGIALLKQKRYHEALEILRNAEKIEKSSKLSVLIGKALFGAGKSQSAREEALKALETDPQNNEAYYLLGDITASAQDLKGALEIYQKVLDYDSTNPEPHFKAAKLYTSANRVDMAISEMHKAIEKAPENARAREQLGVLHARQGDTEQALKIWEELLAVKPDYANAYYDIALLNMKSRNFDNAVIMYLKAVELEPQNPLYLYSLGLAYRQKGLIDESVAAWKRVLDVAPDSKYSGIVREMIGPETDRNKTADFGDIKKLYNYAVICEKSNQKDEAYKNYRRIIELSGSHIKANLALVPYYREKGMYLDSLVNLIIVSSNGRDVNDQLGQAYIDYGLVKKGFFILKKQMSLDEIEKLDPSVELQLIERLARALEDRRAWALSGDKYIELSALNAENSDYLKKAAANYIKADDNKKALRCYERILLNNPEDIEALTALGGILAFTGDFKKGCEYFEKACVLTDDPDILIKYGDMLRNSRKYQEARIIYKRALSSEKITPSKKELINSIMKSMSN